MEKSVPWGPEQGREAGSLGTSGSPLQESHVSMTCPRVPGLELSLQTSPVPEQSHQA